MLYPCDIVCRIANLQNQNLNLKCTEKFRYEISFWSESIPFWEADDNFFIAILVLSFG